MTMSEEQKGFDRRAFLGSMAAAAGASGLLGTVSSAPARAQAASGSAAAPTPMRDVAGKVAFITGGSSGIGLGQAHVFHDAGMKVVIGYIRDDQIGPALDSFKSGKERLHAIKVNVVDRAAMKAAADEIEAKFGRIHLVSNNAGIGPLTKLLDTQPQDFDQTIAINLTGVYNGIHEFVPRIMKHGEGGHVVTTSSMSGILPTEGGGAGAYTASKFAVTGMMEILRSELDALKANIGASVYCPGLVATNIFELEKNINAAFGGKEPSTPADAAANTARIRQIIGAGMDPIEAAQIVLAGIRNNDLFILSHPEFGPGLQERSDALLASVPATKAPPDRLAQEQVTMHNSLYVRERDKLRARRRKA
jgi:NAD(P)-dependent dehydrogenase (short-subunit alcohol dehydrogenase family)